MGKPQGIIYRTDMALKVKERSRTGSSIRSLCGHNTAWRSPSGETTRCRPLPDQEERRPREIYNKANDIDDRGDERAAGEGRIQFQLR